MGIYVLEIRLAVGYCILKVASLYSLYTVVVAAIFMSKYAGFLTSWRVFS